MAVHPGLLRRRVKKLCCLHCIKSGKRDTCVPPCSPNERCPNYSGYSPLFHTDLLKIQLPCSFCHSCSQAVPSRLCVICAQRGVCGDCEDPKLPVCLHCLNGKSTDEAVLLSEFRLPRMPIPDSGWSLVEHLQLIRGLDLFRTGRISDAEFWQSQPSSRKQIINYLQKANDWVERVEFSTFRRSLKKAVFREIYNVPINQWAAIESYPRVDLLITRLLSGARRSIASLRSFTEKAVADALVEAKEFRRHIHRLSSPEVEFEVFEKTWLQNGLISSSLARNWLHCRYRIYCRGSWITTPPIVFQ